MTKKKVATKTSSGSTDAVLVGELCPNSEISKLTRYKWRVIDSPGELAMVPKRLLNVDHTYQRDKINKMRVNNFAASWSHLACLALGVARRPDGSLFVFDGQHRLLAAKQRMDIKELPCVIFQVQEVRDEAKAFIRIQSDRGQLSAIDKFKSLCTGGNPTALAVKELISRYEYNVRTGKGRRTIGCVTAMMRCHNTHTATMEEVWGLCVAIHDGAHIEELIFRGLFSLERYIRRGGDKMAKHSIMRAQNANKLIEAGAVVLMKGIRDRLILVGGGEGTAAEALTAHLNKGRRTQKIPYQSVHQYSKKG